MSQVAEEEGASLSTAHCADPHTVRTLQLNSLLPHSLQMLQRPMHTVFPMVYVWQDKWQQHAPVARATEYSYFSQPFAICKEASVEILRQLVRTGTNYSVRKVTSFFSPYTHLRGQQLVLKEKSECGSPMTTLSLSPFLCAQGKKKSPL